MKRYVEFPLETEEGSVLVEVSEPEDGYERASRAGDIVAKAGQTLDQALEKVKPIAKAIMNKVSDLGDALDEVAVEFGIKMDGKWGLVVVSGSVEANFKISLKWKGGKK